MRARGPIRICERAKGVFEDYLAGAPARNPGSQGTGPSFITAVRCALALRQTRPGVTPNSFLEDQTRPIWRPCTHPAKGQRNICNVPIRDYQSG